MKKYKPILRILPVTLLCISVLVSCNPPVTFKEPQPAGVQNSPEFPKHLQGTYLSVADSSTLIISNKVMRRISLIKDTVNRDDIDTGFVQQGDTLFNPYTGETFRFTEKGGTLYTSRDYIDTIFQIDYDNVLRKWKGYYFINIRYDKEAWVVKKVELNKGKLSISSISALTYIEKLKEITEATDDTLAPYSFAPTKKEFSEFVKEEGFGDTEIFIRISRIPME